MIDILLWGLALFVLWNVLSVVFLYSRRWVDRNKYNEDIIKCKWIVTGKHSIAQTVPGPTVK